jgi:predicted transcriptional regulator
MKGVIIMPQIQLPLFPPELTEISKRISFQKREGKIYYFHYLTPLFSHEEGDLESFRFVTSQLVINGIVKEIEIARAFGVPYISVKRSVKRLKEEGAVGFFKKRKGRTAHVLTEDVIEKAQNLLNKLDNAAEVARRLDLKANTIRKAIQAGRLKKKEKVRKKMRKEKLKVKQKVNAP